MAALRLITSGEVGVGVAWSAAWNMIRFQSVTSSASAAAGINTASAVRKNPNFLIFFIKLLFLGRSRWKATSPNANAISFLIGNLPLLTFRAVIETNPGITQRSRELSPQG